MRLTLRTCAAALLAGCVFAVPAVRAASVNPHIAAFVQVFANGAPAVVRCPDTLDEWSWDLGSPDNPDQIFGRTIWHPVIVEFRPDLCPILDDLARSTADDSTKALAVLTLLHESYHVRHWTWRLDEARVECQAIRHFRAGVRVLGGSGELADRLFPYALFWHDQITQRSEYALDTCRAPVRRHA